MPDSHMSKGRKPKQIMMIYDAPVGKMSAIIDSAKKVFGLGCSLCTLTHGLAGKRKEWEECEKKAGVPINYLHRDEIGLIEQKLGKELILPCVLVELENGDVEVLLSDITIKNLEDPTAPGLIEAMQIWAEVINVSFKCK